MSAGEDDTAPVLEDAAAFAARLPERGALLAVDPGGRRVGVAVSDPTRTIATPLETVTVRDPDRLLERLAALARERGAVGVVVGHPVSMDGRRGPAAEAARELAERIAARLRLPVLLQDERLSTFAVEEAIREGRLRRPRRGPLDHLAAAVILEDALEALRRARRGGPAGEPS